MISAIVCVDNNWGIGKNNQLLFNLKPDIQFFRGKTMNKIVCMGENTLLSFPNSKALPNRLNIVLCREGHTYTDCVCVYDFSTMVDLIKQLATNNEVFIIGGGMFYKSMLPYYDKVYVNKVNASKDADIYFPNLDEDSNFELDTTSIKTIKNNLTNNLELQFTTYRRIKYEN